MPNIDTSRLPERPDLSQERKRAKDLLKAVRSGDGPAIARFRSHHPRLKDVTPARLGADAKLSDAQWVIAREYGFASWSSLKAHIEQVSGRPPGMAPYIVLIWNDATMLADVVVLLLKKVFGKSEEVAQRIMLDVHHEGFGVGAVCDRLEEAEAKIVEAQAFVRERGFVVDLKLTCVHGEVATMSRSPRLVEKELGAARARQVQFDNAAMYVELVDGRTLRVPLEWFPELLGASADQHRQCMLSDQGRELSWDFGLVVSVSGLLAGRAGQAAVRPPPLPSVGACRQAVSATSRQAAPLAWAAAQSDLGHALFARGGTEWDGGSGRAASDNPFIEDFSNEVMFMSYLYSKSPETGVPPHIGTGGSRTRSTSSFRMMTTSERKTGEPRFSLKRVSTARVSPVV
jgi:ATP-dependent Clp protease adapter protein ClpS